MRRPPSAPRSCPPGSSSAPAGKPGERNSRAHGAGPFHAYLPGLGPTPAANCECDQRDGVGRYDGAKFRPCPVDRGMERILRRWPMQAVDRAVGPDADDVFTAEVALIDASRRDPDVAVLVADRQVAARGRG